MVTAPIFLTLQHKKQLTHDVWELEYASETPFPVLPGQFLLCDTAWLPRLRRSYSVSWSEEEKIFFIIKRLPDGKWGSVAICDQEIWHRMQVWWPMGRFVLQNTSHPKIFIGTGTGFAPLYFMLKTSLMKGERWKVKGEGLMFLFWVRELRDVFYLDELKERSQEYNFDYQIYCSRETSLLPEKHLQGRVTEFFQQKKHVSFSGESWDTEFYICGSPAMVTEVRTILKNSWVSEEKVFFEQY